MTFDTVIGKLNLWGDHFTRIAWPLFWQSSILIVGMFVLDLFLRRKLRPSVRHALWLVVLVKLLLPPSFALPSGIAWWLRPREAAPARPPVASYVVTYGPSRAATPLPPINYVPVPAPRIRLLTAAWALFGTAGISLALLTVMLARWRSLRHQLNKCQPAPIWLEEIVHESYRKPRRRKPVRLMLTDASISPALCGLFRPVILLPAALVSQLTPGQLRAVLLHELFHLRNGDVWVNCFQSLLQIVFWWHPFLWLASARIRRIREEVVDDSVRLALGEEAESYAPTLLEVARLALARPLATLGLVGILESRHALKQRVARLVNFPAPRRVGLSIISGLAIVAFASVALPMGQAPPKNATPTHRESPTVYYTFDQSFLDYFGSNGVNAVNHALAQNSDVSNLPQNDAKSVGFDYYLGNVLMNNGSVTLPMGQEPPKNVKSVRTSDSIVSATENDTVAESTNLGWDIQPIGDDGWVEYDVRYGIATATNGAVVRHGGTAISADNLTVNQQTGEVIASGSVKIQSRLSNSAWEMESASNNGRLEYNVASGFATATNGAVLRHGDRVIRAGKITYNVASGITTATDNPVLEQGGRVFMRADNITIDQQAGKAVVYGHYNSNSASANVTNLQLAQVPPSPYNNPTRGIHTSTGKRAIMNKLEAIRLNHVSFDNLPLSEVVNYLQTEAKKRDPEGKGVNFLLNPNADLAGAAGPPAIDPATGLQVPPQQVEPTDINGVAIRILPPLDDVRMIDVLDAITKVADKRIRYSIEDYGVSFWLAGNATAVPLFTRVYKVDPNIFAQGLESVVGFSVGNFQTGGQGGGGGQQGNSSVTVPRVQAAPNAVGGQGAQGGGAGGISGVTRPTTAITQQAIRQFFANAGVDLTPPKSVFFNNGEGRLLVHATMDDFDVIEKAVGTLSAFAAPTTTVPQSQSTQTVPSQTNQTNVLVLGDKRVAAASQVRTVEVAVANSPQQIPNVAVGTGEKLLTETMMVEPTRFCEWVKKSAGLPDNANPQETMDAFRKILLERGLQLAPPANVIYSERSGSLLVRANATEMHVIEQVVQELNR